MVRVASFHRQTTRPLLSSASYSPAAIEIGGSTIRIEFAPGDLDLPVTKLIAWVSAAAGAVTDYYGRFPVGEARILIIPVENREGVLNGTSWGTRPAFTRIYLGELTNDDGLKNDWVMTHEMVHYSGPNSCRKSLGRLGQRPSIRTAAFRRRRPRSYAHLGPHLLGRRDVLFAC